MPNTTKLFLADDIPSSRMSVQSTIALRLPQYVVTGHGSNLREIRDAIKNDLPDILLLDFMANGFDVATKIKTEFPQLRIFILPQCCADVVRWYNSRKQHLNDLETTSVTDEQDHLSWIVSHLTALMILQILSGKRSLPEFQLGTEQTQPFILSYRERQILILSSRGFTSEAIARRLSITKKTVEGHRTNILKKTGTKNMTAAVAAYLRQKNSEIKLGDKSKRSRRLPAELNKSL